MAIYTIRCIWVSEGAAGPPYKVTHLVERETPLSRGAIAAIVSALRLADLQGFDPVAENSVATASFCYTPAGAAPQQARRTCPSHHLRVMSPPWPHVTMLQAGTESVRSCSSTYVTA